MTITEALKTYIFDQNVESIGGSKAMRSLYTSLHTNAATMDSYTAQMPENDAIDHAEHIYSNAVRELKFNLSMPKDVRPHATFTDVAKSVLEDYAKKMDKSAK